MTTTDYFGSEYFDKPATHALWSPLFDQRGNFLESVQVGKAIVEKDSNGNLIARVDQLTRARGFDSGYLHIAPLGQQPPKPPARGTRDREGMGKRAGHGSMRLRK